MARLMSVAFTLDAVRERRKTVTRRKGWAMAEPGMRLDLCEKVMGRRKGEPLVRVARVVVVSARRERLDLLTTDPLYGVEEMAREGFPFLTPALFIHRYFTEAQGIQPYEEVTRIEWRYLDEEDDAR